MQVEGLIRDLALILILGAVVTVLFKLLKQPVVLGYIVAGFLASPHFAYLPSVTTESNIEFWAQIGIIVLLFSLGLEFSFKKLMNAGGSAVVTALIIVCGMLATGYAIGHLMGFSNINSLFLGGMLSMSSTTIIIKAFTDMGLRHQKFAANVFAVLIVEDLFAVLMMVVLSSIAINNSVEGGELLWSVSKLGFFLIIWFLVGVFVLPSLLNSSRRFLNSETLLIVSMGLCLGMSVFSVACGFSLALGAFVMGSILAGTSFAERIEHVVMPVKDLFGSVFFISVGMMVNPEVIVEYWSPILILSAVVICGMILFGTSGMLLTGQTLKVAIQSGFSLTQIGEFAFIIASLGMSLGVLDPTIYPIVVAVSVLTTFTTPYFIRMANPVYRFLERRLPKRLHFLIDRYSTQASTESESGILWHTVLKRYAWRILLYSIVLIAITLISLQAFIPWMTDHFPVWGRLAGVVVSLAAMSPFLLALSLPASKKVERERLVQTNARFDLPLLIMRIVRFVIALGFVVALLSHVYSMTIGWTFGLAVFVIMMVVFSRSVRRRMRRIESRFLENLNERDLRRTGRNNNLVSNMHLAFLTVGYDGPYVGERLADSNLRKKYGVNVASIQRNGHTILVPGPDARLFPGDVLGIIGTDDEIQRVIPLVECQNDDDSAGGPEEVKLTSIHLTEKSPLAGQTSQSSDLRGKYKALLVNIQRGDEFLAPDGTTRFMPGDVLWMVGNPKIISKLR
ncbi:MAG: sodium:proton antiporter [Bacteroides sp.]|nr:sodium:proton antiporter [Bacteroides sp.]MBD5378145.1 sodium:proton antiporter [Bacteroides sp.]